MPAIYLLLISLFLLLSFFLPLLSFFPPPVKDTHTDRGFSTSMLIIHQLLQLSLRCSTCGRCAFACVRLGAFVMSVVKLNPEPIKGCYVSSSSRASRPGERRGVISTAQPRVLPLPPFLQGVNYANLFFSIYLMKAESALGALKCHSLSA